MNHETEIAALKERIAALEEKFGSQLVPISADRKNLPVNHIAYEIAFAAWVNGDRKAMKAYTRMYRVPT